MRLATAATSFLPGTQLEPAGWTRTIFAALLSSRINHLEFSLPSRYNSRD